MISWFMIITDLKCIISGNDILPFICFPIVETCVVQPNCFVADVQWIPTIQINSLLKVLYAQNCPDADTVSSYLCTM